MFFYILSFIFSKKSLVIFYVFLFVIFCFFMRDYVLSKEELNKVKEINKELLKNIKDLNLRHENELKHLFNFNRQLENLKDKEQNTSFFIIQNKEKNLTKAFNDLTERLFNE